MTTAPSRVQRRPLVQSSSREAHRLARAARLKPGGVPARILEYVTQSGGACDFETERACGLTHQQCSAERRHLVERGLLYASDEKRPAPSGVACIVWVATKPAAFRPGDVPPLAKPNGDAAQGRFATEAGR